MLGPNPVTCKCTACECVCVYLCVCVPASLLCCSSVTATNPVLFDYISRGGPMFWQCTMHNFLFSGLIRTPIVHLHICNCPCPLSCCRLTLSLRVPQRMRAACKQVPCFLLAFPAARTALTNFLSRRSAAASTSKTVPVTGQVRPTQRR